MIIFLKKVMLFLIPVGLFYLFPVTIVVLGKEYLSMPEIVDTQKIHPESIFGFAYSEASFIPYKKLLIESKKPEVIALGTSRVMQIRKEFFVNPDTFVNSSVGDETLGDMSRFVKDLPEDSGVKLIILGIDQGLLYQPNISRNSMNESSVYVRTLDVLGYLSRKIYIDYLSGKYSFSKILENSRNTNDIGISAFAYKNGFRSDGSYKYGKAEKDENRLLYVDTQIARNIKTIENVGYNKSHKENSNLETNLEILNDILENCKRKGIEVVGFAPVYPEPLYEAMVKSNGYYHEMIVDTSKKIEDIFYLNGFPFYDLSSPKTIGGKNTEFIDNIHGTDVMSLRTVLFLGEHTKILEDYVDVNSLKEILKKTKTDFLEI